MIALALASGALMLFVGGLVVTLVNGVAFGDWRPVLQLLAYVLTFGACYLYALRGDRT